MTQCGRSTPASGRTTIGRIIRYRLPAIAVSIALAIQACGPDSSEKFEVLVWVYEPVSEEDLFPSGDIFDGPCGPMRLVTVRDLRELSGAEYDSLERALEFSGEGEIVGEWRIPVESYVTGIKGEWLTISSSDGHVSVNRKGDIRRADQAGTSNEQEYFGDCPAKVLEEFRGPTGVSEYLECWKLKDETTNETRLLAYQGVCT